VHRDDPRPTLMHQCSTDDVPVRDVDRLGSVRRNGTNGHCSPRMESWSSVGPLSGLTAPIALTRYQTVVRLTTPVGRPIDPPEHLAYRRLLNPWFSPDRVEERWDPFVREVVTALLANAINIILAAAVDTSAAGTGNM